VLALRDTYDARGAVQCLFESGGAMTIDALLREVDDAG
jgi:hypothetical protein